MIFNSFCRHITLQSESNHGIGNESTGTLTDEKIKQKPIADTETKTIEDLTSAIEIKAKLTNSDDDDEDDVDNDDGKSALGTELSSSDSKIELSTVNNTVIVPSSTSSNSSCYKERCLCDGSGSKEINKTVSSSSQCTIIDDIKQTAQIPTQQTTQQTQTTNASTTPTSPTTMLQDQQNISSSKVKSMQSINLQSGAGTRKLNATAPTTCVPLTSPPSNVPMFVNRYPNNHPTYLPPHIRNIPKTQSLDLVDTEMPTTLLSAKQTSFEQNRHIYPNVPYSPYGSPFGSPRNRRRAPLRESRRISIEQTGSFLQLNQYKLMDQIGQVR